MRSSLQKNFVDLEFSFEKAMLPTMGTEKHLGQSCSIFFSTKKMKNEKVNCNFNCVPENTGKSVPLSIFALFLMGRSKGKDESFHISIFHQPTIQHCLWLYHLPQLPPSVEYIILQIRIYYSPLATRIYHPPNRISHFENWDPLDTRMSEIKV